jgi:hypothetical protein
MSEPQSFKNTIILINSVEYEALISSGRSEVSTNQEKFYNYRGMPLETGGGTTEYGDITVVFAEREFDKLRTDLGAIDADGNYMNDLNDFPFTMTMKIEPDSTYVAAKKEIIYENCRIKGKSDTEIAKDNVLYTTSTTISVENIKERPIT